MSEKAMRKGMIAMMLASFMLAFGGYVVAYPSLAEAVVAKPAGDMDKPAPPEMFRKHMIVKDVLDFETMLGVSGAFLGSNQIREVPGAGSAWTIKAANGSLDTKGNLRIKVKGLVLVEGGANPIATFRGLVSCLDADGLSVNTSTGDFPADEFGNAKIREKLILTGPCFAPIIFVTGPEGQWFAVTGHDFTPKVMVPKPVVVKPKPKPGLMKPKPEM